MVILPVVYRTRIFVAGIKGDVDRELDWLYYIGMRLSWSCPVKKKPVRPALHPHPLPHASSVTPFFQAADGLPHIQTATGLLSSHLSVPFRERFHNASIRVL